MLFEIDHDEWNYSLMKLPKASSLKLGEINGVLPFDGVRNPSGRSSTSHKVHLTYRTYADGNQPRLGIAESTAEAAVAHELLVFGKLFDLKFQPLTVEFANENGRPAHYTHDLLATSMTGHRRLFFVRNESSLSKPKTMREIEAIAAATPPSAAHDMMVVNAADYTRQRRENLYRMHEFVQQPDPQADSDLAERIDGRSGSSLVKDLIAASKVGAARSLRATYRAVAQGLLRADLDNVLWEHSRVEFTS